MATPSNNSTSTVLVNHLNTAVLVGSGIGIAAMVIFCVIAIFFAAQSVFDSATRPYFLFRLYRLPGLLLYVFGSRTTWRTQAFVLGKVDDSDALEFKRAVQDECTMISVAVSLMSLFGSLLG
jgi:hypothetical protein